MRTAFFSLFRFRYIVFGFLFLFFLALAPLNRSFAVGVGQACINGTQSTPINCDSPLICDTSSDTSNNCDLGRVCHGVCTQACTVSFNNGGNNPCPNGAVCQYNYPQDCNGSGTSCTGKCVLDTSPHVDEFHYCTYQNDADVQGNCKIPYVCQRPSDLAGKGICMPKASTYTCNALDDSRPNVQPISCGSLICAEDHGTVPQPPQTCDNSSGAGCPDYCPNCTFSCHAPQDVNVACSCNSPGFSGSGQNGFTCQNKFKSGVRSFCQLNSPCANAPGSPIDNNDLKAAFGSVPKSGITCGPVQYAAPAAPPCAVDLNTTGGRCTAILSSLGIIGTDPAKFIEKIFGVMLAAGGAIALILFMRAGYRIMTSRGNPEGIKEGREQIVAAIVGLMFIIFSFVILQVIGVDLLRLPGAH